MVFSGFTIRAKALSLFVFFLLFSMAVTVFFAIRVAEFHFSGQVENMLSLEASSLNEKLESYKVMSRDLNSYIQRDTKRLLDSSRPEIVN